nr:phosphonate metabolism protein/1,5-bisphosphokinase (PRPP-forming) PhnN [uncultured Rhodoferax sp.]
MSGLWVFVCGPSGAGKDSVMRWAAERLHGCEEVVFARRMITRATHQGSDHDPVSAEQFAHLAVTDGLAWQWHAHGFGYGIHADYAAAVAAGRVVVVNGSREHVHAIPVSQRVRVVHIEADAQHLAQRLAQRSRESPQEMAHRLARNAQIPKLHAHCTILNQGELADAGLQLVDYLRAALLLPVVSVDRANALTL